MQKGQQPKLTARGLDPFIPLPKIEAMVMTFGASAPALIYGITVLQRQLLYMALYTCTCMCGVVVPDILLRCSGAR